MAQMVELGGKNIKTAIINILHVFKEVEESTIIIREIKAIKKMYLEHLEMKHAIYEKNTVDESNNRLNTTKEKIGEFKDITKETIQNETGKKKD